MEMPKEYSIELEKEIQKKWEESKIYKFKNDEKRPPYIIDTPPPYPTGRMHLGHALNWTYMDIIARFKRMNNYDVLFPQGWDCHGLPTEVKVEEIHGITKSDIDRHEFRKLCIELTEENIEKMREQVKSLGISIDWDKEYITMNPDYVKKSQTAFVRMYENGLIYRGKHPVNWCPRCQTAIAFAEVDYKERTSKLNYIKFPYSEDENKYLEIATSRPELLAACVGIVVHPEDERYKDVVGKTVKVPLFNQEVKVYPDNDVEKEFGTGVVKVTPAHDHNDYEVGKKHNLEFITIFNEKGILNSYCGEFEGLDRLEARDKVVAKLEELGFIEKIEDYKNQVGHCYRCKNVVEPYISKQWFLKKEVAENSIKKMKEENRFFPKHWQNSYTAWMDNLRDWCISRQLWWGHRIPVFTCESCHHEFASETEVKKCEKCGSEKIVQDPDVLDTWFSSALWQFSTLGWGQENLQGEIAKKFNPEDLKTFYPNSLLITGFDILFFWVARMIMMGEYFLKELPFKDIYLHALVRDAKGEKMSKSKGNVIDPLETIEKYSADALRFTLAVLAIQGRDIRLSDEKLELSRNFTNKLYNISKYLLLNGSNFKDLIEIEIKTDLGKYALSRFTLAVEETKYFLDQYRFNDSANVIYKFLWDEFANWVIELSKVDKNSIPELGAIFKEAMKLLHPFMPFISEFIYHDLSGTSLENSESIMIKPFPNPNARNLESEKLFSQIIDAIVSIRRLKATIDLANKPIPEVYLYFQNRVGSSSDDEVLKLYIQKLAKVENVKFSSEAEIENSFSDIGETVKSFILAGNIDLTPVLNRLKKQEVKLQKEIGKLEGMLKNKRFLEKAPKKVVEENQETLKQAKNKIFIIQAEIEKILKFIQ